MVVGILKEKISEYRERRRREKEIERRAKEAEMREYEKALAQEYAKVAKERARERAKKRLQKGGVMSGIGRKIVDIFGSVGAEFMEMSPITGGTGAGVSQPGVGIDVVSAAGLAQPPESGSRRRRGAGPAAPGPSPFVFDFGAPGGVGGVAAGLQTDVLEMAGLGGAGNTAPRRAGGRRRSTGRRRSKSAGGRKSKKSGRRR